MEGLLALCGDRYLESCLLEHLLDLLGYVWFVIHDQDVVTST